MKEMNGNATKEGITCDFEALAAAGIGGVQMFDAGCDIPAGPIAFNSPEWFDMLRHAASEARRLGLDGIRRSRHPLLLRHGDIQMHNAQLEEGSFSILAK